MLTYNEAITQIIDKVQVLQPTEMPLINALGLILAEDVVAPYPIPPFANSAMDGFAVCAADVATATEDHPVTLTILGESAAGSGEPPPLQPHTAIRIMTGAPVPQGADAVVPVEDTETQETDVLIKAAIAAGRFIRESGEDVAAGTTVVSQDSLIRTAEIGMCATVGRQAVHAYPQPRVAIISTGDELIEPGSPLQPGQIYNSNAYALAAQVLEAGGRVIERRHARDTPESLRSAFDACAGADVILTSGGVSVGGYDYVKSVFAERGTVDFWRVAIRPGKPLVFGHWDRALFFGLPGNPISSLVTFELFVRPALLKMRGLTDLSRPLVQARLTKDVEHEPGRQSYQRAFVSRENDQYLAHAVTGQGSHQMSGMVAANALLILPVHVSHVSAGEMVTALLLDSSVSL